MGAEVAPVAVGRVEPCRAGGSTHAGGTARAAAAVLGVCGAFLALTCLPGVHWHDTGEFTAVTWWWSVSHPPSHPVHAMLARPVMWLPAGDLAFRANLSSGLWLATALALLVPVARFWAPRLPVFLVAALCAAPVVWPAVWLQGARAEVYALQLFLMVSVVLGGTRLAETRDARWFLATAFAVGLTGACHSLLGLALLPVVTAVAVWVRLPTRAWLAGTVAGVVGLLAYAYLPLRAHAGLDVGWGNPTTFSRLADTLLARDWHKNLISEGTTGLDLTSNLTQFIDYGMDQLGLPAALLLGLAVCVGLPRAARARPLPMISLALGLGPLLATRFFYPFDAENPDIGGYLAPALVALLLGAAWALDRGPRGLWLVLALAPWARMGWDPGGRQGSRGAEAAARSFAREVPPGGVLVLADYGSWFQSFWLRAVMGERPDLLVLYRGRIGQDWYAERARRVNAFGAAGPEAARLSGFPASFATGDAWFEVGVERERLGPLAEALMPTGVLWHVGPSTSFSEIAAAWRARTPKVSADRDTALALAFQHALAAEALLGRSPPDGALVDFHIAAARALVPGGSDAFLDALEGRRRGSGPTASQGL